MEIHVVVLTARFKDCRVRECGQSGDKNSTDLRERAQFLPAPEVRAVLEMATH